MIAFTEVKPGWADGNKVDLTLELFLDLKAADGSENEPEITAFYRIVNVWGEVYSRNSRDDNTCIVDGVRVTHPCGLIEWRDREWLTAYDRDDTLGADHMAERDAGISEGGFAS